MDQSTPVMDARNEAAAQPTLLAGAKAIPMRMLPPNAAVTTFDEVILGYSREEAVEEARRAGDADLSSASQACPFGVDVPALVSRVQQGDFDGALGVVLESHPWPGILGRWCNRWCETSQVVGEGIDPIAISGLERAAADHGNRAAFPFTPGAPTGARIAIVGAGSAASAAAYKLRQYGHHVTVFDQLPVSGGMMFAGYPNFRLPVSVLRQENTPEAWGVEPRYGVTVDGPLVERLVADYDAVLLGTGKFTEVRMGIPGEDLDGVWDALHFLTEFKLGRNPAVGKKVVVLGAGYTAQDASRTCRRLGSDVVILYRRTKTEMPVLPYLRDRFVTRQVAEGAPYRFQETAIRVLGLNGKVTGLECVRTELGELDESGRPTAVVVDGSNFTLECDMVIEATGEVVDLSYLPHGVRLKDGKHVWVDERTWMTSLPRLFATGEMTGLSGTAKAFASGLSAAERMQEFLGQHRS
jgi:NADPH-dependent glutamate synthase beta subunit-like oxidoreductase